jgi:hypothetical protein
LCQAVSKIFLPTSKLPEELKETAFPVALQAFKQKKLNPAEHFGTFKHQPANRGSRNSPERPKTGLTKLTKLFTMEA